MSVQNVKAGRAYVEIGADSSKLGRDLRAAHTQMSGFADSIRNIGLRLGAVFSGALIANGVLATGKSFADTGSALDDLSQRSGVAVEKLSGLSLGAKLSDVSMEALGKGFSKMQQFVVKAAKGNEEANATLGALNLNVRTLARLAPDKQFEAFAESISKIQDPSLRVNAAMEVFSKTGYELLPLLAGGKRGLRDFQNQASELGLVMSTQDAQSAAVFGDAIDTLTMSMTAAYNKIGAALAPMLTRIAGIITSVSASTTKWLDRNRALIALITPIVAALGSAGAAAIGVGLAFKVAAIAIGPALVAAFAVTQSAIAAVIGVIAVAGVPVLAAIAAIGGLTATMYALGITWTDVASGIARAWTGAMSLVGATLGPVGLKVASWVSQLVDGFAWLYSGATQYFGAIGKALADGNLEGAGAVAMAGLTRAFRGGFNLIYGYYLAFIEGWNSTWDWWTTRLAQTFILAWSNVENAFTDTVSFLTQAWHIFTSGLTIAWNTTIGFIQKAWIKLKSMFDKDINVNAETTAIDNRTNDANRNTALALGSGMAAREKQRQERKDLIARESGMVVAGLEGDRNARQQERQKQTDQLNQQANSEFDKARADYQAKLDAVKSFVPKFESRKNKFGFDSDEFASSESSKEDLTKRVADAQNKIEVKGSFNAFAAGGLAGSDQLNKSAAETARNTAEMIKILRQGGFVFT